MVHNGAGVGIGTLSKEEGMQVHRIIETTDYLKA